MWAQVKVDDRVNLNVAVKLNVWVKVWVEVYDRRATGFVALCSTRPGWLAGWLVGRGQPGR